LKKIIYLFVLAFLANTTLFAQNDRNSSTMEALVRDFVKHINEVPKLGTSDKVMAIFHKSFHNEVTIFDLRKKMETQHRNYLSTQQTYNRYIKPGSKVEYEVKRFLKSYSNDSIGYVVFELEYQLMMDGKAYRKGEQTITYQATKNQKDWQFTQGISFIHYKEVNKGSCDCTLFNKNSEYVATLQLPDGDSYATQYHTLKFKQVTPAQQEVVVDGTLYVWTQESKSYITTPDKRSLPLKGKSEGEVVNAILNDLHKDHCFNVTFTK
jgi:hypothetical protein